MRIPETGRHNLGSPWTSNGRGMCGPSCCVDGNGAWTKVSFAPSARLREKVTSAHISKWKVSEAVWLSCCSLVACPSDTDPNIDDMYSYYSRNIHQRLQSRTSASSYKWHVVR